MTPCYRSSMMSGTIFSFIWQPFVHLSNSLHLNIGLVLTHEIKWFDLDLHMRKRDIVYYERF